jgi:hypothetical protein
VATVGGKNASLGEMVRNLGRYDICPSSEFLGQRAAPIKGGSGSSG